MFLENYIHKITEHVQIPVQQIITLYLEVVFNVNNLAYYVLILMISAWPAYLTIIYSTIHATLPVLVVITIIYLIRLASYADHHAKLAQMKMHALVAGLLIIILFSKEILVFHNVFQGITAI